MHEILLLWRFHPIHQSAEQIDWLVNSRVHPVDMVFLPIQVTQGSDRKSPLTGLKPGLPG